MPTAGLPLRITTYRPVDTGPRVYEVTDDSYRLLAGLRGQAADIAIQAEQLAYTKRRMAELTAHHSGKSVEAIQKDSERDRWFTAEQAKEYGLVDKVILKRGEIR